MPDMGPSGSDVAVGVSEFVAMLNDSLEAVCPFAVITGELAHFRVSKNRWVYFDLKDESASVEFFGTVYQLPGPLEDGIMLRVTGVPRLHARYGFSVNVLDMRPAGEGSIRRAAEMLAAKLAAEGLFDPARKRPLPYPPRRVGLITSRQSAAYSDFVKVLAGRWGGLRIDLADVQVQGEPAPAEITRAIEAMNALPVLPDVLVITRGGGSADDLASFNHEQVVRAVAASRIPTLVAVGHESDTTLSELAADQRASTPSNAAELLVPDRRDVLRQIHRQRQALRAAVDTVLRQAEDGQADRLQSLRRSMQAQLERHTEHLARRRQLLEALSPGAALARGYAVVRSGGRIVRRGTDVRPDDIVDIMLSTDNIKAAVTAITLGRQ